MTTIDKTAGGLRAPSPATETATAMAMAGAGRRRELAEFLRARRARIAPTDVGLPPGLRRRTPGLRREELAQLAGVGVTWYTWLEQGRPIHASVQVLDAIARTLRLDQAEVEHLYRLAEVPAASADAAPVACPEAVREILESLEPLPAMLLNARYDILKANRAHEDLLGMWPHPLLGEDHNLLWCGFTQPEVRRRYLNFDQEISGVVATLRASFARHLNEPAWTGFIQRLSAASPQFAALWTRQEVASPGSAPKYSQFLHPEAGLLRLRSTSLGVADMPETHIVVFTPADQETHERLPLTRRTPAGAAQPQRPPWTQPQPRAVDVGCGSVAGTW